MAGLMMRLREFFQDERKPVSLKEFSEFYKSLSDSDKIEFEKELNSLGA